MELTPRAWIGMLAFALVACGSSHPPPAPAPASSAAVEEEEDDAGPPPPEPAPIASLGIQTPERTRAPSTATYEQAMSTPEKLEVEDDRPHLTDAQLRGPMPSVTSRCRVPPSAKVTIRTAVQNGRAIGVTVEVRFEHPPPTKKSPKRPSPATLKREAKIAKDVAKCIDRAVRLVVWPPNSRRDSFTTEF